MNAIYVERVNLTGGPLDDGLVPVTADQQVFEFIANDRTHTYLRIGNTRNFFHVGTRANAPTDDGFVVESSSLFQDEQPDTLLLFRLASINWIHKLRSLMG